MSANCQQRGRIISANKPEIPNPSKLKKPAKSSCMFEDISLMIEKINNTIKNNVIKVLRTILIIEFNIEGSGLNCMKRHLRRIKIIGEKIATIINPKNKGADKTELCVISKKKK